MTTGIVLSIPLDLLNITLWQQVIIENGYNHDIGRSGCYHRGDRADGG
jgi:hypothetical protein